MLFLVVMMELSISWPASWMLLKFVEISRKWASDPRSDLASDLASDPGSPQKKTSI